MVLSDVVEVSGLNKTFRSGEETLRVLSDLELTVRRGSIVAITGASGSGKSTLLHLLGGMDRPDSGRIRVDGIDLPSLRAKELAEFRNRRVGFVFQFHHLLPEFTALENVMFPLLLRRTPRSHAAVKAQQLLRELELEGRSHHRPGELSGGEQQRVAIARALSGDPILLLADEPTGNLDPKTSLAIYQTLINVHARHDLTSIVVTHNSNLASLCDRRLEMVGGRLVPEERAVN